MIYIEFEEYRSKYLEAQKKLDAILSEKEVLFAKTQPQATTYDKEKVSGSGEYQDSFTNYLIAKENKKIDIRLEEAKSILTDRKHLMDLKEQELRLSNNKYDEIYVCRYLETMKVFKIARIVSYSEPQIYRILKIIRKNLKHDRK